MAMLEKRFYPRQEIAEIVGITNLWIDGKLELFRLGFSSEMFFLVQTSILFLFLIPILTAFSGYLGTLNTFRNSAHFILNSQRSSKLALPSFYFFSLIVSFKYIFIDAKVW